MTLESQNVLNSGQLGLISLSDNINHHIGTTVKLLSKPDSLSSVLVLAVENGSFRIKLGDLSVSGPELVVNGNFAADTNWTKGVGWSIAAGVATSDASQVADSDLEQTLVLPVLLKEGESYDVAFTVSGYVAGNITPVVGGTEGTDRAANGVFNEVIVAGSSQVLALRADLDFDGSVDDFSVKVAVMTFVTPITTTGGSGSFQVLEDRPLAITAPKELTVIGETVGSILTYYYL